jgi:hypothetical protein
VQVNDTLTSAQQNKKEIEMMRKSKAIYGSTLFLGCFLVLTAGLFPASAAERKEMELNLLPQPQFIRIAGGGFKVRPETPIYRPEELERPEQLAVEKLSNSLDFNEPLKVIEGEWLPQHGDRGIYLMIRPTPMTDVRRKDGYILTIDKDQVVLSGNSPSGLFYGLQTLDQLIEQYGNELPALEIMDEPDFAYRGIFHDVARGKVAKLETLKWLVDLAAGWKCNQFQLNVEHNFAFAFDPEIARDSSPLTVEEIKELDRYAKDRRVDLVPALQVFGHMGHILSMPKYRQLAEIELEKEWEDMDWNDRMRGATLNPNDPESRELVRKMLADFLPAFSSDFFNANADETFDLGRGKNKELAEQVGSGRIYLEFISFLNDLVKQYDKRMMMWGDVVKHHPDLVPEIPEDVILLNWGYSRKTDFEQSKLFADAGLDLFVCPGTSGWNRILNGVDNADDNIRGHARAGKKYGALGLLNTDWGDHGHYNLLSCSLHGFAVGAAMAWNEGIPGREEFDRVWSARLFDAPDGQAAQALREQSWVADSAGTWIMFYRPLENLDAIKRISNEDARKLRQVASQAADLFNSYIQEGKGTRWINEELRHACRMNALLGEKVLLARRLDDNQGKPNPALARDLKAFADRVEKLFTEYEQLWMARNRESNFRDIRKVVTALIAEARDRAEQLQG